MAWNKDYKKQWSWQKKEKHVYKPKRGPLKPLMSEEEKASAKVEDLAYDFACRMTRLYQWGTDESREIGNQGVDTLSSSIPKSLLSQIFRSGTSIGANMNEAKHPQSDADFLSKANIALKETRETEYWLNLLHDNGYINNDQFSSLNNDLSRLLRILVTIVGKVSKRLKKGSRE